MTRSEGRRARLGMTWFALALGALALLAMPGLASAKDRNHDRIPDRWEKRHKLSLEVNQARRDQDHDRLRNRAEFLAGVDPRDSDSDDDGVIDGKEQAGTIVSFDEETGRLVVDLFGDDAIGGFVTDETEIECETDRSGASASSGESESGEETGSEGEGESGDGDEGEGEGEEPGDEVVEEPDDSSGPGESSGPGPGEGEESDEHGDRLCTAAELVPGAVVEEAELKLRNGRAVFEEIELSGREA